jgi:hypothetical protein
MKQFFKNRIEDDLLDDFCKLIHYLLYPNEIKDKKEPKRLMYKIINENLKRGEIFYKTFENNKKCFQNDSLIKFNKQKKNYKQKKIIMIKKEIIISIICFDKETQKFNIFIPRIMRLIKDSDYQKLLEKFKKIIYKESNPILIFDENNITKLFKYKFISIQNLLKVSRIESNKDLVYKDYIEFYNFLIEQYESLDKLKKIINIII